ncbi:O-methyltransferase [Alicyclobacillus fastidiosus]|uniref:O-methyltransferase n=1 Tax=Alicyclobacillus fastidiosus TaxID=392011 RepID=UPI0023E9A7A1|nr:O-methyltransferase [Alicyclobacillus fastidiosus]GMA61143.1 hypothetical protein GCM10025859_15830 [Alicyclobacillus fastidiosus]
MEQRIVDAIRELEQLDEQTNAPEPLYRISADNGQFLNLLVRVSGAKRVLEIGSSSGYSGLYLGEAARANGGTVTTCELSEYKIQLAKSVYEKAGLSNTISIVEGDALETLKTLQGPWDFVFIDAWKEDYPAYLHLVWPHVKQGV